MVVVAGARRSQIHSDRGIWGLRSEVPAVQVGMEEELQELYSDN